MIFLSEQLIGQAVVCNICKNIQVTSPDRSIDHTLSLSGTESRADTVYHIRIFRIAFVMNVLDILSWICMAEFHQMVIYLGCKITTAIQRGNLERRNR